MKRMLCLFLCILTAAVFCACSDEPAEPTSGETAAVEPATEDNADTDLTSAAKTFLERFDDTPTVGDKLIYQDENITVTVHGINYAPIAGPELHLTIENHLPTDITVQSPYAVVNDCMLTPELSIDVPSGKSANGNMTLSYTALAYADIYCIKNIDFALRAVETKNYNPLLTTELISLKTSAADATPSEAAVEPQIGGQVAYDDKDLRILFKNPQYDPKKPDALLSPIYNADGDALLLVDIENNTDRAVAVRTDDVTVNGYEITSVMNRTVLPGKRAVVAVTFYRMDLDEFDIDTIDSVKMSFQIKDSETWETIDATDMIAVKLKAEQSSAAAIE